MNKEYKLYKTRGWIVLDMSVLCVQAHGNTDVAGYGSCPVLSNYCCPAAKLQLWQLCLLVGSPAQKMGSHLLDWWLQLTAFYPSVAHYLPSVLLLETTHNKIGVLFCNWVWVGKYLPCPVMKYLFMNTSRERSSYEHFSWWYKFTHYSCFTGLILPDQHKAI